MRLAGWLGVVVLLAGALPLAAQEAATGTPEGQCLGTNPDAPVVMEVFSDHQCPACRRFYLEVTRPVLADYANKGKVCVIYYDFPLSQHQHARQAARFAQAAGRIGQNEWIRVTDALYVYQAQWAQNGRVEQVVQQALPAEKMAELQKHLSDPKLEQAIDRDVALGRRREVRSTPTILITANGKTERIPGGVQYEILRRYLDSLVARANAR